MKLSKHYALVTVWPLCSLSRAGCFPDFVCLAVPPPENPTWTNSKKNWDPTTAACDIFWFCFVDVHFVPLFIQKLTSRKVWTMVVIIFQQLLCSLVLLSLVLPESLLDSLISSSLLLSELGFWSFSSQAALIFEGFLPGAPLLCEAPPLCRTFSWEAPIQSVPFGFPHIFVPFPFSYCCSPHVWALAFFGNPCENFF